MGRDFDPIPRDTPDRSEAQRPERQEPPALAGQIESRESETVQGRGYTYQLSPAERAVLDDVGRFRTVNEKDVLAHRYRGESVALKEDLDNLKDQGLMQRRHVWGTKAHETMTVLVLTKRGKELLRNNTVPGSNQQVYSGFVKPAEIHHDAAIYRMYHAEATKIARAGGRVERVVLDFELKQKVYRPLAKSRDLPALEYTRKQAEVAAENKLKVVEGKILLPDLRIEYKSANGDRTHVDLELATHHYRASQMRAKAQAGFKIYAPSQSAGHTAAFDPERIGPIFSF